MDSKQFGAVVRKTLEARGVKFAFAAGQIGMSRQVLYAKMLGVNPWKLDEALKAIKAFGLPQDILMK